MNYRPLKFQSYVKAIICSNRVIPPSLNNSSTGGHGALNGINSNRVST